MRKSGAAEAEPFLTTSARSSAPFLEEANSLLGRTERRTDWCGPFGPGASMSPIWSKKFPHLELPEAPSSRRRVKERVEGRTRRRRIDEAFRRWKRKQ